MRRFYFLVPALFLVLCAVFFRSTASAADSKSDAYDFTGADFTEMIASGAPTVTTNAATFPSDTGATLNAQVNPNTLSTTGKFLYGTSTAYTDSTSPTLVGTDGNFHNMIVPITGLTSLQTYHFRATARSSDGTTNGADMTFTTGGHPFAVSSAVTGIGPNGVVFEGSVTPNLHATTVTFDYGTDTTYGSTAGSQSAGSGQSAQTITYNLASGLSPATTYHWRTDATNSDGEVFGTDQTFTTLQPPNASTGGVDSLTGTSAFLEGTVNPLLSATTASFVYGTSINYGSTSGTVNVGSDNNTHNVGVTVTGLTPGTTYHYQLIATSAGGSDSGGDNVFTTIALPTAGAITVYGVGSTNANFELSATAGGASSLMAFEWVTDSTKFTAAGTGVDTMPYSSDGVVYGKTGTLNPNTTYFVRARAINVAGNSLSPVAVFATSASSNEYTPDSATAGLYHFDGRNGSYVEDYSFYNRNGTATAPDSLGKYATGKYFDLSTDEVAIADPTSAFAVSARDFTIETWIYPSVGTSGEWTFVSKGQTSLGNAAYQLSVSQGKFDFLLSASGSNWDYVIGSIDTVIQSQQWQHVAVTVDQAAKVVTLYVNGHSVPYSVITGSFPNDAPFASNAPLGFGLATVTGGTKHQHSKTQSPGPTTGFGYLDEIRLSSIARDSLEFTQALGAGVTGFVYNDSTDDGLHEPFENGVAGWKVYLLDMDLNLLDSTYTNAHGGYDFIGLNDSLSYFVSEADSSSTYWIENFPVSNLFYVDFKAASLVTDDDFENYHPCTWIGGDTGCAQLPQNWSCGHVPTANEGIHVVGHVAFTCPPPSTILSFDVDSGGSATFHSVDTLNVTGPFNIRSGGTVTFDLTDTQAVVYLGANFSDFGVFNPGTSTFVFNGSGSQTIGLSSTVATAGPSSGPMTAIGNHPMPPFATLGSRAWRSQKSNTTSSMIGKNGKRVDGLGGSTFFNLTVAGSDVQTAGNVIIENQLEVDSALNVGTADTVVVSNTNSGAISGSGKIVRGNIRRAIDPASSSAYRFESAASFLAFTGGTHPGTVTESTMPDTLPRSFNELYWVAVPSTVDTNAQRVEADGLHHLSRWVVGKPSGGSGKPFRKSTGIPDSLVHVNAVARVYGVTPSSEGTFTANASFSYTGSEEIGVHVDNTYSLFRGPYSFDTVDRNWNILSLPVVPEDNLVADLFPTASTGAFNYDGNTGYHSQSTMQAGTGYWLKFPATTTVAVQGSEDTSITYNLQPGWNMVGTISYLANASDAFTTPDGLIQSQFYGYANGYQASPTLAPARGYWVKVGAVCQLTVTTVPAGKSLPKSSADPLKNLSSLIITDANGSSQTLYFGADNTVKASTYEMPPAPPRGIMDARFADNHLVELAPASGSTTANISIASAVYPVRLQWITPKYLSGVLHAGGQTVSMSENGSMTIGGESTVSLVLQKDGTVSIPKTFALYQNYPNPFNPTTNIKFDLPKDAVVTLKIYNVLGQEVAALADHQNYKAGSYSLKFNSSSLSSGMYFYSITAGTAGSAGTAGEYSSVKKMMFIK